MALLIELENFLHEAMRQKDETSRNVVRLVLSSIKLAEVEKGEKLDENAIVTVLHKEIKMRKESIIEFQKGNREDLIIQAEKEINILERFLPAQLSDDEIKLEAIKIIKELSASTPADIGKVMKIIVPLLAGKAPADRISAVVRSLLA